MLTATYSIFILSFLTGKTPLLFNITRHSVRILHRLSSSQQDMGRGSLGVSDFFFSWNRQFSFLLPHFIFPFPFLLLFVLSSSLPASDVGVRSEKVQLLHNHESYGGPGQAAPKSASMAYWFQIKATWKAASTRETVWPAFVPPGDQEINLPVKVSPCTRRLRRAIPVTRDRDFRAKKPV